MGDMGDARMQDWGVAGLLSGIKPLNMDEDQRARRASLASALKDHVLKHRGFAYQLGWR